MDKNLMIYPFNKRVSAIARYAQLLKGYILTAAVSPKNYGYDGKDVSYIDGGEFVGITITSSFREGLEQCDCILFSASTFLMDMNYYEEKIQEAGNCGKEIWITKELVKDFTNAQKSIPTGVKVLGSNPDQLRVSYNDTNTIQEINVPILSLFQVGEFCHGFDTQLLMAERFEKEGYRVSKVSSNTLGALFNVHMVPDYIYDPHMPYEDKIVSFNHFLNSIVEDNQPDILLLEVEEAILPYNNRITNHFGVIPTIISKSAQADVSILSLYYSDYNKEYLDRLRTFCRYALNAEVNYINMTNETMFVKEINYTDPLHYVSVDRDILLNSIGSNFKDYDCMFFHTYDLVSVDAVYRDILCKLSQNEDVVITG